MASVGFNSKNSKSKIFRKQPGLFFWSLSIFSLFWNSIFDCESQPQRQNNLLEFVIDNFVLFLQMYYNYYYHLIYIMIDFWLESFTHSWNLLNHNWYESYRHLKRKMFRYQVRYSVNRLKRNLPIKIEKQIFKRISKEIHLL